MWASHNRPGSNAQTFLFIRGSCPTSHGSALNWQPLWLSSELATPVAPAAPPRPVSLLLPPQAATTSLAVGRLEVGAPSVFPFGEACPSSPTRHGERGSDRPRRRRADSTARCARRRFRRVSFPNRDALFSPWACAASRRHARRAPDSLRGRAGDIAVLLTCSLQGIMRCGGGMLRASPGRWRSE